MTSARASGELLQEPQAVLEEHAQVRYAVTQEGDAFDAHPEREALHLLGVVAVALHEAEHVRVDHPGAEDLDPAGPLAERVARAVLQVAVAAAVEAGHVDLDARLGEREVARSHVHLALGAEDRPGELAQDADEVAERDVLVDREALDLVEHR